MTEELGNAMEMKYDVKPSDIKDFFKMISKERTKETLLSCPKDVVTIILNFENVMNNQAVLSGLLTEDQQKKAIESLKSSVQNITKCLDSFKNYYKNVYPILEKGSMLRKIIYARDMFKTLKDPSQGSKSIFNDYNLRVETVKKVFQAVTSQGSVTSGFKFHEKLLETIQLFKDLRKEGTVPDTVLTVGFGNYSRVHEDIQSEWFKSKLSQRKPTVILEKSLEKFMAFGVLMQKLRDTFWDYSVDFSNFTNLEFLGNQADVFKDIEDFKDIGSGFKFLESSQTTFKSCWTPKGYDNSKFSNFDQKIDSLIALNSTVTDIMEWINETIGTMDSEVMNSVLGQLESLDFGSKNINETKESIMESIESNYQFLMDYCSRFSQLKELQDKFQQDFDTLSISNIDDVLIDTIEHLKESTVTNELKCLKDKKFETDRMKTLIGFIESLKLSADSVTRNKTRRLLVLHSNMRKAFVDVEAYVEKNMKGQEKQEVLEKFKARDSAKVATSFGAGIRSLNQIINSFRKRDALLASTSYSQEVNDHIVMFNEKEYIRNFWKVNFTTSIREMVKTMDALNDFCGKVRQKGILEIREVFEQAKLVLGLEGQKDTWWFINKQLDAYKSRNADFAAAAKNSEELQDLWFLDFANNQGDLVAAKLSVQQIKEYFDEIFELKPKEKKIVENSYLLVILITIAMFFLLISVALILFGRSESGRRLFQNYHLYYFGKPEDFEKRWRYSLFLDRLDGQNALIDAVREINPQNVQQAVRRGAYINVYNEHGNTPLHMAAKRGYSEIVEILIKNGADRTLLNARNKTPEQMIGTSIRSVVATEKTTVNTELLEKTDKVEKIFKKYQNKKFRIRVPEVFPTSSFHIYADKNTDDQLTNRFMNAFQSILLPTTTHIIVKTDQDGILNLESLDTLAWILSGVILVKESWMTDCLNNSKLIAKDFNYLVEKVRYKGTVYSTVTQWTEAMAKGTMPYLYGVYLAVTIQNYPNYTALLSIVSNHGGVLLDKFPEKSLYNIGSHPYLHAHLGPIFLIHDGKTDLSLYREDTDKMFTLFTEEEFVKFLLKREINRDTSPNPMSVSIDGED
ncbi:hypothetical protein CAEBREN_28198 [Caenorhabditis brenneri]|uniref:BRCT domain-containing protein n=1 Tax=Caenorhabditis brenneri TaxID=135651 RepID=G0MGM8_CAEBE|nr:hypothetical protein CAEBREN_28198 [Caenorhabditis brenneri]